MPPFRVRFLTLAALLLASGPAMAAPKVIKANVAEPVVQELMGGCSLKCAVAWRVEVQAAPETKPQATKLLNDESALSSWQSAPGSTGVGTRFRVIFPKKLPVEMEGQIPLYGLDVINGLWKEEDDWKAYGRLRKVRLFHNDQPICDVSFPDARRWEKVEFADFMLKSGDTLTMEVLETYPGTKAGLAVTELVLQGGH